MREALSHTPPPGEIAFTSSLTTGDAATGTAAVRSGTCRGRSSPTPSPSRGGLPSHVRVNAGASAVPKSSDSEPIPFETILETLLVTRRSQRLGQMKKKQHKRSRCRERNLQTKLSPRGLHTPRRIRIDILWPETGGTGNGIHIFLHEPQKTRVLFVKYRTTAVPYSHLGTPTMICQHVSIMFLSLPSPMRPDIQNEMAYTQRMLMFHTGRYSRVSYMHHSTRNVHGCTAVPRPRLDAK